jgi:H+/Cl- antiporter ClcA
MLIAGAASGLAAAFNTLLGGIIFAIEELSQFHIKYYKSPLFIAVIISGLVAQGLGGSYLYLGTPRLDVSGFEVFLAVIVVSVLCGYFGSKMCHVMRRTMNFFRTFSNQKWEVGIILLSAILMATAIFFLGTDVMGSGKQIMTRTLFTEDKTVAIYPSFARMAGLITSFSFDGAGGIFAPSLSTGAAFGALIAQVFDLAGGNADLLILVGMAGFLTSVTRTPFTSAIIIFEMTDRHSIIFMLLIGSIIANVISSLVEEKSFYDYLRDDYLAEIK